MMKYVYGLIVMCGLIFCMTTPAKVDAAPLAKTPSVKTLYRKVTAIGKATSQSGLSFDFWLQWTRKGTRYAVAAFVGGQELYAYYSFRVLEFADGSSYVYVRDDVSSGGEYTIELNLWLDAAGHGTGTLTDWPAAYQELLTITV